MNSQFAANFAAICRDKFSLSWIPVLSTYSLPSRYSHNKGRPSEMSREIVPVEFINFLWRDSNCTNLLVPEEGTPSASRIRRHRGGNDTTESDRLISKIALFPVRLPSPSSGSARDARVHAMYDIPRRISPHLQPSAECWFSLPWVKWVCRFHLRNHRSPIFSSKSYRLSTRRKLRPALNAAGRGYAVGREK